MAQGVIVFWTRKRQRRNSQVDHMQPVKDWVWCRAENRPHLDSRPTSCRGPHYGMVRATSSPGLHIGRHERLRKVYK